MLASCRGRGLGTTKQHTNFAGQLLHAAGAQPSVLQLNMDIGRVPALGATIHVLSKYTIQLQVQLCTAHL